MFKVDTLFWIKTDLLSQCGVPPSAQCHSVGSQAGYSELQNASLASPQSGNLSLKQPREVVWTPPSRTPPWTRVHPAVKHSVQYYTVCSTNKSMHNYRHILNLIIERLNRYWGITQ